MEQTFRQKAFELARVVYDDPTKENAAELLKMAEQITNEDESYDMIEACRYALSSGQPARGAMMSQTLWLKFIKDCCRKYGAQVKQENGTYGFSERWGEIMNGPIATE